MDKNNEVLEAFINWFMREYSNFGGKPISERYEEAFDTFNNDFIDARYDAFQDGWKAQQAKVEELQTHAQEIHKREIKLFEKTLILTHERDELQKRVDTAIANIENFFDEQTQQPTQREYANFIADVLHELKAEQALKGESSD